jgi:protein involved in polysaccharide export with SLBB domain
MMRKILILLICMFKLNFIAQTQETKPKGLGINLFDESLKQSQVSQYPLLDPNLLSLERPINPETYIVGPGDIISVSIWTSPPLSFTIQVTVEGTVIIPNVGEVKVSGLTLSETKEKIIQKIKSKYIASEITATLIMPRSFNITLTGYGLREGKYKVRSIDRVSNAISFAFSQDSINLRKILLKRNGNTITVDLRKYFATGDDKYNPYLLEGDWIVVQKRDLNFFVGIYGAVNKPGLYEFVEGDKLTDIVQIAGGPLESAMLEAVEILRLNEEGKEREKLIVNLKKILNGEEEDIKLENNDRIFIPERKTLKQDYKVVVLGEVKHPGVYPISANGTKLSEVINKAGLTIYSDLGNAMIIKKLANYPINIDSLIPILMLKGFGFAPVDSGYFLFESSISTSLKFASIDIEKVASGEEDYELQDGDLIYIPQKINSVYIFGQVNNPGFVPYEKGKSYKDYILKAGGFSQFARKNDVKVIKRKTYNWYNADKAVIEPGDYIFVPKKIIREPGYYWNLAKDIILTAGAVASTVATIILITREMK